MILRKKLQALLYALYILYVFESGGRASDLDGANYYNWDTTELWDDSNTISSDDYTTAVTSGISKTYSTVDHFTSVENLGKLSDADDTDNTIAESETSEVQCTELPQLDNLAVVGVEYGLTATWNLPEDVSCLQYYVFNIKDPDDTIVSSINVSPQSTFHTFTDLSACTTYTIEVNPLGVDNSSGTIATINGTTSNSVPGPVTNLKATSDEITQSSVPLTWSAPTLNPSCIQSYAVSICYEDDCTEDSTTNEYYTASSLSPCLTYTFNVTSIGVAGSSETSSTTAETSYLRPGYPSSMTANPGQFSLEITWEAPETGATCVSHYRVTLWDSGETETTADTNITFSGLYACKTYTVQVTPVSVTSGDGSLASVDGTTEESVNDPPELESAQLSVTKSTISIGWRIVSTMNECDLEAVVTTCYFNTTAGHGFEMLNGASEDDISNLTTSTDTVITITVSNLSPFTSYNCYGVIRNVAGNSTESDVVIATTAEDAPSAPILSFNNSANTTFTLSWEIPQYLPGHLIEYEILISWIPLFLIPSMCGDNESSMSIANISGSALQYSYEDAIPYSNYTAQIRAQTNGGWGNYSNYTSFDTSAGVPGAVTNVKYLNSTTSNDADVLDTFLFWGLPCSLNGEIESFSINVYGIRQGFDNHELSRVYDATTSSVAADSIFNINFGELNGEYNYTFHITAKVIGVHDYGPSTSYNVIYPAGIPPRPKESYMDAISVDPYKVQRSSSAAMVLLPLFENTNGEIQYYAVMISELGQNTVTQGRFDILSGAWPNTTSWQEAMLQSPVVTYQATESQWHPAETNHIMDFNHLKAVAFMIGNDSTCTPLLGHSQAGGAKLYCNGPLRPDTLYQVRMRAFTNGGYRDSEVVLAKTEAEFNLGLVIGVVFGILFLGIITMMVLLVRRGTLQATLGKLIHPSVPRSAVPDPLPRKKFEVHCQELIENPGKLSNEFQLLNTLSIDLQMSSNAASLLANKKKNRYMNILPYDISRVKLEILDNDPTTDYINASFINGYSGAPEYIACQGPKEETTYDFWRMVFQYNIKVIVMVTQLVEKGKDKCHQYYPTSMENFKYEDMTIRCSTQLDFVNYTHRVIILQKGSIRRSIIHMHFKEWSDHGVPDDVHSMIQFCQIVRKQITDNKGIAVVHCSAGVGRTGTLLAIDILLQQIRDNKKLDVFGTVYRLRQHRINMVQTESQYAYIYNCTKQVLNNPYQFKFIKASSVEPIYENLTKKKNEITDSNTNLVNSAETLKKVSPSSSFDSMDQIYNDMPIRPTYGTQLSVLSNNGLRYSKSTGAIEIQITPSPQIVRNGSHEYPIFDPTSDSLSSRGNFDRNSLLTSTKPIQFEIGIPRSKSARYIE